MLIGANASASRCSCFPSVDADLLPRLALQILLAGNLMYAYLTEIAFWGLVIFLCLGASYVLLKLSAWLTGLMTGRLERALRDQEEQKRQD